MLRCAAQLCPQLTSAATCGALFESDSIRARVTARLWQSDALLAGVPTRDPVHSAFTDRNGVLCTLAAVLALAHESRMAFLFTAGAFGEIAFHLGPVLRGHQDRLLSFETFLRARAKLGLDRTNMSGLCDLTRYSIA